MKFGSWSEQQKIASVSFLGNFDPSALGFHCRKSNLTGGHPASVLRLTPYICCRVGRCGGTPLERPSVFRATLRRQLEPQSPKTTRRRPTAPGVSCTQVLGSPSGRPTTARRLPHQATLAWLGCLSLIAARTGENQFIELSQDEDDAGLVAGVVHPKQVGWLRGK